MKVYENGWEANSIPQLKRRICYILKNMGFGFLEQDMSSVQKKWAQVAVEGRLSVL